MTDEQIIFNLECCAKSNCFDCSFDCLDDMPKKALDLIKRQQAEIKRLKTENERVKTNIYKMAIDKALAEKARAEAIKEFAERLKEIAGSSVAVNNGQEIYETKCYNIMAYKLDDLVKEMGCGKQ